MNAHSHYTTRVVRLQNPLDSIKHNRIAFTLAQDGYSISPAILPSGRTVQCVIRKAVER